MKHTTASRNRINNYYSMQPAYPNAADTNYFTKKALEILTAVVSGMGCLAAMVFLVIIA